MKDQQAVHVQLLPILGGVELVQASRVRATVPRHIHTSYCVGLIEAGARQCVIRGTTTIIPAGSMVVINPGEAHTSGAVNGLSQSYRMFSVPADVVNSLPRHLFVNRQRSLPAPYFSLVAVEDRVLFAGLQHVADNLAQPTLEIETVFMNLLARLILLSSASSASGQEPLPAPDAGQEAVKPVVRAREFIDAHYDQDIRIDDLARAAGLSPFHLVRLFARVVGIPPHSYQTLTRLREARKLLHLHQDMTIADVAAQTGFFDQSHFTNTFKRYVGVTPSRYADPDSWAG